jgi:hypothetical protein
MVHGHFQEPFKLPQYTAPMAPLPPVWGWPRWDEYQELLRKAKAYDEAMKQPNCPDPNKEALMAEIERKLVEKYGLHPKGKTT